MKNRPKKAYGQHFLINKQIVEKMLDAAEVSKLDTVLEIGPGHGAITIPLSKRAKRVIAIEADREIANSLKTHLPGNVTLVNANAVWLDWSYETGANYKILANLPFAITAPIIRRIFSVKYPPTIGIFIVQREVAKRLTASSGESDRGYLTIFTEARADLEMIEVVPRNNFSPVPKVDAAIIRLKPKKAPVKDIFWPVVEAGFRHQRQTLVNALTKDLPFSRHWLESVINQLQLPPRIRPHQLTIDDWQKLSQLVNKEI